MDAQLQLDTFIQRFNPEVANDARRALALLSARIPTATRLVYDNYNALAIAFAPATKASEAILSIALYPRYVSLFFAHGASLSDPNGLLEGRGSAMRHIKLTPVSILEDPDVLSLIDAAVANARVPLPQKREGRLVIKSVSAKQRPRRLA